MNPLRAIDSLTSALKQTALAVYLGAAALLGLASSAHAQLPVTSGLVLRMDASQITGTTTGSQLGTWADTSGLGNNAERQVGSSTGYPMYVTGALNGQPVVRFNSANGNTGDYFQFTRITTIRTVFWVLKENAGLSDGHFLLGDSNNSTYQFHRASANGPLWDSANADANIMNGTTKLMGNAINGTTTALPSGSFQLVSLVTADNVQANNICQDRIYHGSWQGDIAEILIYNRALTGGEELQVGTYLSAKYGLAAAYPASAPPTVPTGVAATPVYSGAVSVSWPAVSGATSYSVSYKPTVGGTEQVVNGVTVSPYTVTGLTNDTSYDFKVSATNAIGSSAYSSIVTATPALGTAKNILTFVFPGQPDGIISGTNISVTVPTGTDVTALAPTYTVSALATGSPASGTTRNFTSPQTYTITAEDTSTQVYTVTVTQGAVASIFTWTTGSGNWSDSSKWTNDLSNGLRPATIGQSYYTFNFNQAVTTTNDLSANYVVNKLNFGNAVTIAATNSIRLAANGATLPQINQNSVNQVTLSSPLNLAADTTLGGSGTGAVVIGGVISGAGKLTKTNGGTLSTLGNNTYTGGTLISAGTVYCGLQNPSPLGGTGSVNVTIQSGGTLQMDRNQITGSLTLNGGKVATGNGWSDDAWNGPVTLSGNSTIDVGGTDGSLALYGVVSGTGTLTKLGTSVRPIRLSGANTFTGALSVQAGGVQATSLNRITGGTANSSLGAPTTIANGTISLGAGGTGGTLAYDGSGETTDRVIKLAGTTGSATILQAGTSAGFPTTRGESGLLKFTSDISSPGTAGVDNRKTLILTQVNSAATGTNPGRGEISGSIGDSVLGTAGQLATSVTKSGFSSWTLSGENTYSGATKVQAGTLAFSRSNSLGSGPLDITTGAKVQLDFIGTRQISALTYDAGAAKPNGSYGSSSSLATFKDDSRFSGLGTVTVGTIAGATTTTLARTTGSGPSNGGEALTFTATVAGASPTGNVMFYDGLTLIGTSALNGSFQATVTTSSLTAAVHVISALYVGSPGNAPSSGNLIQTVVETRTLATTTSLALTSGSNPSAYGAAVTFTATVAGSSPAGSVVFYNGASPLGTVTLNGAGLASLTTNNLAVGWRPITVRYLGDVTHLPSATAAALFQTVNPPTGNGKLKVFILSGQSNMVGKGQVEFGRDPNNSATTNMVGGLGSLRNMLNRNPNKYNYLADPANPTAQGNPGFMKRSDVWVNYFGEPAVPRKGILDTDFGNTGGQGLIGPEYGFGLVAGSQLGDQVLLIKVAWGGKSLLVDFRPPGAVSKRGGVVGPYYTQMIDRVHYVLNNLATEFPAYTGDGYEIVGFGWHQGWNDQGQATSVYEDNLVDLIKDVRTEFAVPNLPVSIAITGMANSACQTILQAQLNVGNPALHPEFTGTVASVDTRPFDYGVLLGTSNEGVHWNWNGESYFNIGESMGQAMLSMLASPAKQILTFDFPALPATTLTGTNISVTVPSGTNVTALAPTYTLSPLATASPASGTARNFTTPQTYTVTAQDLTTQVYTVTVTLAASPYSTWASNPAQGLTAGVNDAALADPDGDGLSNLLEFTLGGAPMVSSQAILPALTKPAGSWLFEYERSDAAQPSTTQVVEYGSDLTGWTPVTIPTTSAGIVTITPGSPSDHVVVTLPVGGSQQFVRLKVSQ